MNEPSDSDVYEHVRLAAKGFVTDETPRYVALFRERWVRSGGTLAVALLLTAWFKPKGDE